LTDHEICEQARHTSCNGCGATPDTPCDCGTRGVHMARVARARSLGWLSPADFARAIADADVFTGLSLFLDPGTVPA